MEKLHIASDYKTFQKAIELIDRIIRDNSFGGFRVLDYSDVVLLRTAIYMGKKYFDDWFEEKYKCPYEE